MSKKNIIELMDDRAKNQSLIDELATKILWYATDDISKIEQQNKKPFSDEQFEALESMYAERLALAVLNEVQKRRGFNQTVI